MAEKESSKAKIYRLKLTIVGTALVIAGLLCNILGDWLSSNNANHLLVSAVNSLGDAAIFTGALGILLDFVTGRERDDKDEERQRRILKEMTPDYIDAVLRAFSAAPEDLKRVATPELLDSLATNVMGLRLGDAQFAREIYEDVRDQAIRAPERWHDVEVSIRLSTAVERSAAGTPLFDVLVEWEYTTVPSHPVRKFACVSDRDEYADLMADVPATSTWLMTPRPGFDAATRECFELLSFTVNGDERKISRSTRKSGQTYSVRIGDDLVRAGQPVRIKHLFRVVTAQSGHRLYFELAQPSRDVKLTVDYTDADIARLSIGDMVTSLRRAEINQYPKQLDAKVISAELPGWVLPRAGFTLVWTLVSEQSATADAATSADRPTAA
ncbi:hypothetical protein [Rudaeicoccus suwonensis]|uniref:Uncharacterized protein n=1 Tax=Rudaeicoccus suwonensis TaxID=657409 RepID=A0A561EAE2_9MICO|nr:hypothetical protein [Rudaeicoccus suwonensis]TWE12582.1 hypothetical protein BKA23_1396 [Rudaeicoccus suwonensis]